MIIAHTAPSWLRLWHDRIIDFLKTFRLGRRIKLMTSTPPAIKVGGLKFALNALEHRDRQIFVEEKLPFGDVLLSLRPFVNSNDTVIDVGANVGHVSVLLSRALRARQIYAFEPNPRLYKQLVSHLEINKCTNVSAFPFAIGNTAAGYEGTLQVPDQNNSDKGSLLCVYDEPVEQYTVPLITLDKFIQQKKIDKVSLIKISVEGFEPYVIDGAKHILKVHHPFIVVKANRFALQNAGWSQNELMDLISSYKYTLYKWSPSYSAYILIKAHRTYTKTYDILCVPKSRS